MPASTARLALPYPIPDDTVDVPRDVQALATKLDAITGITPAIVTTLPASPVEGQECVWAPVITRKNGGSLLSDAYWRMRYIGGRWRFLGGAPYVVAIPGPFAFTNLGTSFLPLKTRISIPSVGDWLVRSQCTLTGVSGGTGYQVNLTTGISDNSGGATQWADASSAPIGASSTTCSNSGQSYWRVASLASPNFESWVNAYGFTIGSGTIAYGMLAIEPVLI
jgi:hypothetical protein